MMIGKFVGDVFMQSFMIVAIVYKNVLLKLRIKEVVLMGVAQEE